MSFEDSPAPKAASPLIPILILGVSFLTILIWNLTNIRTEAAGMRNAKAQLADAITKREELVKQSVQLQGKLQAMVVDLLELAKTNEKAKAIVQKYNIQQAAPAAAAPAK